jgi:hypothetical protein
MKTIPLLIALLPLLQACATCNDCEPADPLTAEERAIHDCETSMMGRPTRNGDTSETISNMMKCKADPRAHLVPEPRAINCTADRDMFGRIVGANCQ